MAGQKPLIRVRSFGSMRNMASEGPEGGGVNGGGCGREEEVPSYDDLLNADIEQFFNPPFANQANTSRPRMAAQGAGAARVPPPPPNTTSTQQTTPINTQPNPPRYPSQPSLLNVRNTYVQSSSPNQNIRNLLGNPNQNSYLPSSSASQVIRSFQGNPNQNSYVQSNSPSPSSGVVINDNQNRYLQSSSPNLVIQASYSLSNSVDAAQPSVPVPSPPTVDEAIVGAIKHWASGAKVSRETHTSFEECYVSSLDGSSRNIMAGAGPTGRRPPAAPVQRTIQPQPCVPAPCANISLESLNNAPRCDQMPTKLIITNPCDSPNDLNHGINSEPPPLAAVRPANRPSTFTGHIAEGIESQLASHVIRLPNGLRAMSPELAQRAASAVRTYSPRPGNPSKATYNKVATQVTQVRPPSASPAWPPVAQSSSSAVVSPVSAPNYVVTKTINPPFQQAQIGNGSRFVLSGSVRSESINSPANMIDSTFNAVPVVSKLSSCVTSTGNAPVYAMMSRPGVMGAMTVQNHPNLMVTPSVYRSNQLLVMDQQYMLAPNAIHVQSPVSTSVTVASPQTTNSLINTQPIRVQSTEPVKKPDSSRPWDADLRPVIQPVNAPVPTKRKKTQIKTIPPKPPNPRKVPARRTYYQTNGHVLAKCYVSLKRLSPREISKIRYFMKKKSWQQLCSKLNDENAPESTAQMSEVSKKTESPRPPGPSGPPVPGARTVRSPFHSQTVPANTSISQPAMPAVPSVPTASTASAHPTNQSKPVNVRDSERSIAPNPPPQVEQIKIEPDDDRLPLSDTVALTVPPFQSVLLNKLADTTSKTLPRLNQSSKPESQTSSTNAVTCKEPPRTYVRKPGQPNSSNSQVLDERLGGFPSNRPAIPPQNVGNNQLARPLPEPITPSPRLNGITQNVTGPGGGTSIRDDLKLLSGKLLSVGGGAGTTGAAAPTTCVPCSVCKKQYPLKELWSNAQFLALKCTRCTLAECQLSLSQAPREICDIIADISSIASKLLEDDGDVAVGTRRVNSLRKKATRLAAEARRRQMEQVEKEMKAICQVNDSQLDIEDNPKRRRINMLFSSDSDG